MKTFNVNINIHYSSPQWVWDKLEKIYKEMPGWIGFINGCPQWFGDERGKLIKASVEPGGLQFYGNMPQNEWLEWINTFKIKSSLAFECKIGEVEDGFEFACFDQAVY